MLPKLVYNESKCTKCGKISEFDRTGAFWMGCGHTR